MTKSVMLAVIELLLPSSWYPNCTVSTLIVLFYKTVKNFPQKDNNNNFQTTTFSVPKIEESFWEYSSFNAVNFFEIR
jgi:hypothetical protein